MWAVGTRWCLGFDVGVLRLQPPSSMALRISPIFVFVVVEVARVTHGALHPKDSSKSTLVGSTIAPPDILVLRAEVLRHWIQKVGPLGMKSAEVSRFRRVYPESQAAPNILGS